MQRQLVWFVLHISANLAGYHGSCRGYGPVWPKTNLSHTGDSWHALTFCVSNDALLGIISEVFTTHITTIIINIIFSNFTLVLGLGEHIQTFWAILGPWYSRFINKRFSSVVRNRRRSNNFPLVTLAKGALYHGHKFRTRPVLYNGVIGGKVESGFVFLMTSCAFPT
ncbi:hypothetical protein F4805DRAFT_2781 [Annulohypoxylon moriforme]|nr:hypothetical protein F4805DRAFT_2781 [Annulohypoxylon moriforme]